MARGTRSLEEARKLRDERKREVANLQREWEEERNRTGKERKPRVVAELEKKLRSKKADLAHREEEVRTKEGQERRTRGQREITRVGPPRAAPTQPTAGGGTLARRGRWGGGVGGVPAPTADADAYFRTQGREQIRGIQQELNRRGANLSVDGIAGPKTKEAWLRLKDRPSPAAGGGVAAVPAGVGGGGGGGAVAGGPVSPTAAPMTPVETDAAAMAKYGHLAAFLNHSELGPILRNAAAIGMGPEQLAGAVHATNWWKTTSELARNWWVENSRDPATAQRKRDSHIDQLRQEAQKLGITIAPSRLREIAETSLSLGYEPHEIRNALVAEWKFNPNGNSGQAQILTQDLGQIASQYLVKLDQGTLEKWTRDILLGNADDNMFEAVMKEQAKSLFPSLSAAIDRGITVRQYAAPYGSLIADELGIAPESVDFLDPKWNRFLLTTDAKTGERTSMSLYDTQRTIRTDPTYRWDQSKRGIQEQYRMGAYLAGALGAAPWGTAA